MLRLTILALLCGVLTCRLAVAEEAAFRFVDDRGSAIQAPLEACFQVETRTECAPASDGRTSKAPQGFWALRIEGPDHGPLTIQRSQLKAGADGTAVVRVPRKAELQIQAPAALSLTVSVYPQEDADFRTPVFRKEAHGGERIKVPAGDSLVSLASQGHAPDLHLLGAPPGESRRIKYTERAGWSLLLRCRARKDGRPLGGAAVEVQAAEGFAPASARATREVTSARGLVAVSGLPYALARARVERDAFVPLQVNGISASSGTFAFREAEMEEGATLRAAVTLDGHPARRISCQVLMYDPNPKGPAPEPSILFQGSTNAAGVCRSGRLAAGPYTLRLRAVAGRSFVDRPVDLVAGQETSLDVTLRAIHLAGQVLRGSNPAPSYILTFSDIDQIKPNATRRDAQAEATTDEDGRYSTVLWSPADYFVLVHSPTGIPGASRRLHIDEDDDHIDFHLEENGIEGTVVDERDQPVEGVGLHLTWNLTSHRTGTTDAQGAFSFPVSEPGTGKLQAFKSGYTAPDPVDVQIQQGAPTAPLLIRLKKASTVTAHLIGALGPAAGASVQSYRVDPAGRTAFLGATVAGPEGDFEVAAAQGAPTRLFVSGSGCPLSIFDVQPASGDDLTFRCPGVPSSLEVTLQDPKTQPLVGHAVLIRRDGVFIPETALIDHLARFHLPAATDGAGHVFLVGLAPGRYEIYLAEATDPDAVALGIKSGYLTSADLAPASTLEMAVTVEGR